MLADSMQMMMARWSDGGAGGDGGDVVGNDDDYGAGDDGASMLAPYWS